MVSLLIPIASTTVNLIVQVLFYRHWRGTRFFPSVVSAFAAGFAVFVALEALYLLPRPSADEMAACILVNAPIYMALSYCYYNFVQLGQTSIRIRLYSEIASRPNGMKTEDVALEYSDEELVKVRIQRLIESGDLVREEGRYVIGRRRLLHAANFLWAAKRFLLGRESEFETPV